MSCLRGIVGSVLWLPVGTEVHRIYLSIHMACLYAVYLYHLGTTVHAYSRSKVHLYVLTIYTRHVFLLLTVVSHTALANMVSVLAPLLVSVASSSFATCSSLSSLGLLHHVLHHCEVGKFLFGTLYSCLSCSQSLGYVLFLARHVYLYLLGIINGFLRTLYTSVHKAVRILSEARFYPLRTLFGCHLRIVSSFTPLRVLFHWHRTTVSKS